MKKEIIDTAIQLIKIPSITGNYKESKYICNVVKKIFKSYKNAIIKEYEFNGYPSIIIKNFVGKKADIILSGHLDVVDGSLDQFSPYIKDNILYGRGSGDMKGFVAILIKVMENILKNNFKQKVLLMLTSDEEILGFNGTAKLLNIYKSKIAFLPDAGFENKIVVGEKGVIHTEINIKGKGTHASRAWCAQNPIEKSFKFYNKLKSQINKTIIGQQKKYYTTVSLTILNSGNYINVIPSNSSIGIDIRFIGNNAKKINTIFDALIKEYNGEYIYYKTLDNIDISIDDNLSNYKIIAENFLGTNINYIKEHGTTDAKHFLNNNINTILHRTNCGNLHGKNEFLDITKIDNFYHLIIKYIKGL